MNEKGGEAQVFGRAYTLFFEELKSQIFEAKAAFQAPEELSADTCENLRTAFHKIKGGAGFFQFSELASLGALIEAKLKEGPHAANAARDWLLEKTFEAESLIPESTDLSKVGH